MHQLDLPSELLPSSYEAPRLRLHVLRAAASDKSLWQILINAIKRSRDRSDEEGRATAKKLLDWAVSWRGTETTPEERTWFEDLVNLACEFIISKGSLSPDGNHFQHLGANTPEFAIYGRLLLEDTAGGSRPSRIRSVRVPVAFIPGREEIDPPTIALLELRLIQGANELKVHPSDRWRRDVAVTVKIKRKGPGTDQNGNCQYSEVQTTNIIAGCAQPDFTDALSGAIEVARGYLINTGRQPKGGTIVWRLLDLNNPDQPCGLNGTLQGPSAGGAVLRAALHLLGPSEEPILPRIFVLSQLKIGLDGKPDGTLEQVKGAKAKMIAIANSVNDEVPGYRPHVRIVLAQRWSSTDTPSELDCLEIHNEPVTSSELLECVGAAAPGNRIRLGEAPREMERLREQQDRLRVEQIRHEDFRRRLHMLLVGGGVTLAAIFILLYIRLENFNGNHRPNVSANIILKNSPKREEIIIPARTAQADEIAATAAPVATVRIDNNGGEINKHDDIANGIAIANRIKWLKNDLKRLTNERHDAFTDLKLAQAELDQILKENPSTSNALVSLLVGGSMEKNVSPRITQLTSNVEGFTTKIARLDQDIKSLEQEINEELIKNKR